MIDGSEKRNCQLAFELQNSHDCEKRSKTCSGEPRTLQSFVTGTFWRYFQQLAKGQLSRTLSLYSTLVCTYNSSSFEDKMYHSGNA